MSNFERFFRWILGTSLLAWALAGGPQWAYFGVVILLTGSFGFSPWKFIKQLSSKED